ncbi:hypothetical protein F5B20DRAFT_536014 [Whalleya microplaca]|nr:hypothetical protein F5B20DRAFT_536014 [Whalleya microplaca]
MISFNQNRDLSLNTKMKFNISSLVYLLLASAHTTFATPLSIVPHSVQHRSVPFAASARAEDVACGQGCSTDADCSGTCSFCSTPAEYRWQCLEPALMRKDDSVLDATEGIR